MSLPAKLDGRKKGGKTGMWERRRFDETERWHGRKSDKVVLFKKILGSNTILSIS